MPIKKISINGYRSLFRVHLNLAPVNVLVGANGAGKTNMYRSLYFLNRAAQGQLALAFADEGGMPSALWAGKRYKGPVRLTLSVRVDDLTYELRCGLPAAEHTAFVLDPLIKEENVWLHRGNRKIPLLKRDRSYVKARDGDGHWVEFPMEFSDSESVLSELREPERFPALAVLRLEFLNWRFYHQFRTDPQSPIRQSQVGVRTPVLSHDGRDLAAALQTILETNQAERLHAAVEAAFPGSQLCCSGGGQGGFMVSMRSPGMERLLSAPELSDGTLRYLCLLAVCLSPRPPTFLALNEPETSIHANLYEPLAQLIIEAAKTSQIWVTTHSQTLADSICKSAGVAPVHIRLREGATSIERSDD